MHDQQNILKGFLWESSLPAISSKCGSKLVPVMWVCQIDLTKRIGPEVICQKLVQSLMWFPFESQELFFQWTWEHPGGDKYERKYTFCISLPAVYTIQFPPKGVNVLIDDAFYCHALSTVIPVASVSAFITVCHSPISVSTSLYGTSITATKYQSLYFRLNVVRCRLSLLSGQFCCAAALLMI